ncbi:hypothetical protein ABFS82_01G078500 [Erythranthe guttata]|uniref:uncharacterized protein LOC105956176 isoform X1 n=1 Tax=Erythranthe guttata TaxID=4155 RepID=UPI00064E1467|nr:PREDICTED: uncharacterized protein LOC105956176 isoform X1 [Erythranthe guttata]|eukprot:XP_012835467.1 PREDICTED: uncharacterized protein LOC105956176 isoform X1 [Erythranthe guttata]
MEFSNPMLRRCRSDRRKLLEFLLSSGLIKEITTPAGRTASFSNIDFDSISTDYVLECIQSGGVVDVSQAMNRYYKESKHPIVKHLKSRDIFYLHSDPDSAGSPPRRVPPPITRSQRASEQSPLSSQETRNRCEATKAPDVNSLHNACFLSVGLPILKTGLLDDDLRESAYEVVLACMLFSGVEIYSTERRKKEKGSRFLSGLKNKRDKRHVESESTEHLKIIDTIRIQMQISEATDTFIRRRLTQFAMGKSYGQIDVPQLSIVLLTALLRTDFASEKSYLHWKNRQANVLEELLSSDHKKTEKQMIRASLAKIRNPEEWDIKMSPSERSDVLLTLRQVALTFTSIPVRFGVEGETYYWTTGYHLNIRLYEKLLFGVFDVLEDGKLIEEAKEILKFARLTWSMLGITERLHHALFAWVLFQQFIATEEAVLLDYAICEVEKVLSTEVYNEKEVDYMKSLMCSTIRDECEIRLDLLRSIFSSISSWCDSKLQDYHLHFSQKPSFFERVLKMGLSTGIQDFVPHGNSEFTGYRLPNEIVTRKIRTYIEKTLDAACNRVTGVATNGSMKIKTHPLATLASELKLIAEKDISIFSPVLHRWYPQCAMVSARTLHQFYGEILNPFVKNITLPTEDVRKVLPAAYALEHCLIELYSSACKGSSSHHGLEFEQYPIAEISRSLILDWVVAQHERILQWTGRTFDLEDWEPLSSQRKQAASAVEVFRIIEETVDLFFEWSIPMDITHLQALLSIIFHSLDAYLSKVVSQLVEKRNLYPPTPPLTRYKEATFPIVKKKMAESLIIDDNIYKNLDNLTASKLCIILNTYRYIQKQIDVLEEGIRKSWESVKLYQIDRHSIEKTPETLETTDVNGESVSELFVATLDCIKDSAAHAIRKTSDFLGAKIVFWDMRDSFLYHLYHGGVEGNRFEGVLPEFDKVLNNICGLIDGTIRDLVVSSIWKASLEGLMWVLLDGGPSRAFSEFDIQKIEEDFHMLKDLFVADGEGLPRSLVEEEAKFCNKILSLFSLETESLIQMLMASSEHISVGVNNYKYGQRYLGDAHTLIRVLCHKKDKEASKFLKRHYRLPPSSEYDETSVENSSLSSPLVADIMKKSMSFRWSDKSHSSFRSIRKKFQEATWK